MRPRDGAIRRRSAALIIAAGGLWACCAAPPAQTLDRASDRESTPPPEQAVDCAALSELACIDSADCTLRQEAEGTYACAAPADDCERGFAQRGGRREDCPEGCDFVPARCYCAPDVTCVCGGGPPASCRQEAAETESQ